MASTKITKRKRRIEAVARMLIQQNQLADEDIAKQLHAPLEDIQRWRREETTN